MAAARNEDRGTVRTFLVEADAIAGQLGGDGNRVWTFFGPNNVAIRRVATAAELGDLQVAVDLGPQVDASAMPVERQVRHARALSSPNRRDRALAVLLDAERLAPEQVRYHFLSRQLVRGPCGTCQRDDIGGRRRATDLRSLSEEITTRP
jgi:hypothetical protein